MGRPDPVRSCPGRGMKASEASGGPEEAVICETAMETQQAVVLWLGVGRVGVDREQQCLVVPAKNIQSIEENFR